MIIAEKPTIPKGFYSYESALLAADILKDKISDYCIRPPEITGDLSDRKGAVNKIEITCMPMPVATTNKKELFPKETNAVIEYLRTRYNLDCTNNRARFSFMTIPTTIHFTQPQPPSSDDGRRSSESQQLNNSTTQHPTP